MSLAIRSYIRRYGKGDGFDNIEAFPDSILDEWIADALQDVPAARLGNKSDRAAAYYACHLILHGSESLKSTGGGLKKEKAGDVEIEWHATSNSASSAISDKYLEMYLSFLSQKSLSPIVLNGL